MNFYENKNNGMPYFTFTRSKLHKGKMVQYDKTKTRIKYNI